MTGGDTTILGGSCPLAAEEESSHRRVGTAACFSRAVAAACLAVLPAEEEGVRQSPQRRTGGAVAPKNRGPAPKCAGERSLRSSRCGCRSRRARISNAGASRFHQACTAARARNGMAMGPHPKQGPAPKRTQGRSHAAQCCCGRQCAAATAAAPDVPASRAGVPAALVAAERMQPLAARPSRRRWGAAPSLTRSVAEDGERRQAGSINPFACRSFCDSKCR